MVVYQLIKYWVDFVLAGGLTVEQVLGRSELYSSSGLTAGTVLGKSDFWICVQDSFHSRTGIRGGVVVV